MNGQVRTGIVLVLALMLYVAPTAQAHAELVSSTPAADATLTTAPKQVQLVFSEALKESTAVKVLDASGKQVNDSTGTLDLNDLDHKTFVVALPSLAPGKYTVEWTSVSDDDGDSETGSFSFTVAGAAQPTAAATAQPTAATQPTSAPQATSAAQPTAAMSAALPRTGAPQTNDGWLLLLVATFAVLIGLAVRQSIKHR